MIALGMGWGQVVCNDDTSGVAIWFAPGNTHISSGQMLRVGMGALPFRVGLGGATKFIQALAAPEKIHESVAGPHWYLMAIGVSPESQGTGLGGALLEFGTARADLAGIPCYLETSTADNVAFYSKRGFEVIGQTEIFGFTMYGMVRQPG